MFPSVLVCDDQVDGKVRVSLALEAIVELESDGFTIKLVTAIETVT